MEHCDSDPSLPSIPTTTSSPELPSLPVEDDDGMLVDDEISLATPEDLPDEDGGPLSDSDETLHLPEEYMDPLEEPQCQVPKPDEIEKMLLGNQPFFKMARGMELYSPPRVLPVATPQVSAKRGCWSFDIVNGWDFDLPRWKALTMELVQVCYILFLYLSPPCTMFSEIQRLFNYKRMTLQVFQSRMTQAVAYVVHAMNTAKIQHGKRRKWMYEHPWKASSWKLTEVMEVMNLPGVCCVDFDMCCCGMVSPAGVPVKKRTRIMTNSSFLIQQLSSRQCDRSHEHRPIEGSERGHRMSAWCQRYPIGLVRILAQALHAEE